MAEKEAPPTVDTITPTKKNHAAAMDTMETLNANISISNDMVFNVGHSSLMKHKKFKTMARMKKNEK